MYRNTNIKYYANNYEFCLKNKAYCMDKWVHSNDDEWFEMLVGWENSSNDWVEMAQEEKVYLV